MEKESEKLADDIFSYVKQEKIAYESTGVPVTDNWEFHMFKHINRSFSLKNSKFTEGENDGERPFNNVIIPIANVNYRTEGFDVKDVDVYVDDSDYHHLSLISRKYHAKWAIDSKIDRAIDESVESHFDYGLILARNIDEKRPKIIPLQSIAFCDQSDIMSGPIALKYDYSIDQIDEMKGNWVEEEVEMAILQAKKGKNVSLARKDAKTPGKYIEIYDVEGVFPKTWLNDEDDEKYTEDDGYCRQLHIITFYNDSEGERKGISLYKGKTKNTYKAFKRNNRYGTACGMGGIEELFEHQTWINFSEIHLMNMLQASSKIIMQTSSKNFAVENNLMDLDNLSVVTHEDGKPVSQLQLSPINKEAFNNAVARFEQSARTIGSASDPQLGKTPASGTPLGTTEIVTSQGEGIHDYRRGRIADFWHEIYTDWVTKYFIDDLSKGDKWLDELSVDELREVADMVAISSSNEQIIDMVLSGREVVKEQQDLLIKLIKEDFLKGGKKRFIQAMKGEFKKLPLKLNFNVAGKQKNIAELVSKLNGVFRTVFANPQLLQAPGMSKLFNEILEHSGLSPIDFAGLTAQQPPQPPQAPTQQNNPQGGQPPQGAVVSPLQPTVNQ